MDLQTLKRQAQYMFLSVPAARFFVEEIHYAVGENLGGKSASHTQGEI
jgi:hypothetical protein